jgi:hypothetical protein
MKGQTTVFQKSGEITTAVKADKHHDTLSNEPNLVPCRNGTIVNPYLGYRLCKELIRDWQ